MFRVRKYKICNVISIIAICIFSIYHSNGQTLYSLNNIQFFNPTGNSNLTLQENPFLTNFPKNDHEWSASLLFKPSYLGFSELKEISGIIRTNYWDNSLITVNLNYFGFELFNEFSGNLSYTHLFDRFYLGANLGYNQITVKDFNSDNLFKIDIFGKLNLTEKLNVGFLLNNINRAYFSNYDRTIYQNLILSLGVNSFPIDNSGDLSLAADFGTNLNLNRKSYVFLATKVNLYNLVSINTKIITLPLIIQSGISVKLLDWFFLTAYMRYQKDFNYDPAIVSDFNW